MSGLAGAWRALRLAGAALLAAALCVSCGGSTTPSPVPASTTAATAPAHLPDPTDAADLYRALRVAGLALIGTDSVAGQSPSDPVERINATLAGQPLSILGYASDLGRAKLYAFRDGTGPDASQPAFTFAASNIVVEFGPSTPGQKPPVPDGAMATAARRLATTLQALLGQLSERSAQRVSTPPPSPTPSLAPSTPAPSAS